MNILNQGLSPPGPSPLYPPQPYSLGNERELKKQMKILQLKKVNKRIHQPRKKCLIIQTYGIRHYMKKLFNRGNSQDKPSLQQQVNQFNLGHVETHTMQTADCADCADSVLFFYLYLNFLVKFLLQFPASSHYVHCASPSYVH